MVRKGVPGENREAVGVGYFVGARGDNVKQECEEEDLDGAYENFP